MALRLERSGDIYTMRNGDSVVWTRELALDMSGSPFRQECIWDAVDAVVVAGGHTVHFLDGRSGATQKTIDLGDDHFGHLRIHPHGVYVLGWRRIVAVGRALDVLWSSDDIALDGITWCADDLAWLFVSAEMDPPGGWVDVLLDARTGHELRRGAIVAQSACGRFGEDGLLAWRVDDAVDLEVIAKDGTRAQWRITRADTLRVTGAAFGHGAAVGMETFLFLAGDDRPLTHFEITSSWDGVTHDDAAKLVQTISAACGCAVEVEPLQVPERMVEPPSPPVAPAPPALLPPALPPLVPLPGSIFLGGLLCGDDTDQPLNAFALPDGSVAIENAFTVTRWRIRREDTLELRSFAAPGARPDRVWTHLDRTPGERIAGFYNDPGGADEAAVVTFAALIAKMCGCTVDHRPFCWD